MTSIVLDASVAAKWLLPSRNEPFAAEAARVFDRYVAGEIGIVVPDLFWAELANVLWKSARLGRCTEPAARLSLESILDRGFPTVPSNSLVSHAFDIAIAFGSSVYDAIYVALAVTSNRRFVTADEKLARAMAPRFPVKHLAAF